MNARLDQVDRRFERVELRLDRLDGRIEGLQITIMRIGGGLLVAAAGIIAAVLVRGA